MRDAKLVQNGFYSKDTFTLSNQYKPGNNDYMLPLDERMFSNKENWGTNVFK